MVDDDLSPSFIYANRAKAQERDFAFFPDTPGRRLEKHARRLGAIVALAQNPECTGADLAELVTRLEMFGELNVTTAITGPELSAWSAAEVAGWNAEVLSFVRGLIARRRFWSRRADQSVWDSDDTTLEFEGLSIRFSPGPRQGRGPSEHLSITVVGPARVVLRFVLSRLIEATGFDKLEECPCETLFVRRGRRSPTGLAYCSGNCQRRLWLRESRRVRAEVLGAAAARGWVRMEVAGLRVEGERAWRRQVDTWDETERRRVLERLTPKLTPNAPKTGGPSGSRRKSKAVNP